MLINSPQKTQEAVLNVEITATKKKKKKQSVKGTNM